MYLFLDGTKKLYPPNFLYLSDRIFFFCTIFNLRKFIRFGYFFVLRLLQKSSDMGEKWYKKIVFIRSDKTFGYLMSLAACRPGLNF